MNIPPIKRLLLATDFSHCAARAEDYASALAASWGADLTVMSVTSPGRSSSTAKVITR